MSSANRSETFHLGFLRIVEQPGSGAVGGLLVTNRMGRPLEFQCTTPVKANRTQEILYGPTLRPFVYSELIGKTLWERLQVKPQLLIVNQLELLELRMHISVPVGCILESASEARDLPDHLKIQIGHHQISLHPEFAEDLVSIQEQSKHIPSDADLHEPIDRIGDALEETLRMAS
ncbi:MAG: hypothetical protein R3C01_16800 [Planctomycetaceae bacterium]